MEEGHSYGWMGYTKNWLEFTLGKTPVRIKFSWVPVRISLQSLIKYSVSTYKDTWIYPLSSIRLNVTIV